LASDQWSKVWARKALEPIFPAHKTIVGGILGGRLFWEMRYSENTGSAFGLLRDLPGARYFFVVIGIAALAYIFYYLRRPEADRPLTAIALGLVAGGAVGNIFDRAWFGKVTDFIVWRYERHEWPAFNIADAALVVGLAALLLFAPRKAKRAGAGAGTTGKGARAA
jgi:signal peptidase II